MAIDMFYMSFRFDRSPQQQAEDEEMCQLPARAAEHHSNHRTPLTPAGRRRLPGVSKLWTEECPPLWNRHQETGAAHARHDGEQSHAEWPRCERAEAAQSRAYGLQSAPCGRRVEDDGDECREHREPHTRQP